MVQRPSFTVVLFCFSLLTMAGYTLAQDEGHPTAEQLYQQGMQLYRDGDYEAAGQVFQRIDELQLPKTNRVIMRETTTDIARHVVEGTDPGTLLKQADKERRSGSDDNLASLYESVIAHPDATEQQKNTATARIMELQRAANPQQTQIRRTIDQASADLNAGRLNDAESSLLSVQDSDIEPSWFDTGRIQRLLKNIEKQRLEQQIFSLASLPPEQAIQSAPQPITQENTATAAQKEAKKKSDKPTDSVPAAENDILARTRQLELHEQLARGREQEQLGNYRLALQHYEKAVAVDPTNQEAIVASNSARAKIDLQQAPRGVIDIQKQKEQILRAEAEAEFDDLMNRAQQKQTFGDFSKAREFAIRAKTVIEARHDLFPQERFNQLREQATRLEAAIDQEQHLAEAERVKREEIEQERDAKSARREAEREQEETVQKLLRRVLELQKEQRYDEALTILDRLLFIDPLNIAGQLMKQIVEDNQIYVLTRKRMRQRNLEHARQSNANLEASIPYTELVTYPADWPELTDRRLSALDEQGADAPVNRQVMMQLKQPVPIDFEANRLVNVLNFLQEVTNVNFDVNWPALEAAGVEPDTPISLKFTNVPANLALERVLRQASSMGGFEQIAYSTIDGIVTISTRDDLTKSTDTRVYDIRDLLVTVPNFSNAPTFDLENALDSAQSGNRSGGGGGGGSGGGRGGGGGGGGGGLFGDVDGDAEDLLSREELVQQVIDLIQTSIGRQEEWEFFGGDVSSLRELNGNLIVRSTPDNHRQIRSLLGELREIRALQIHIEARFLLADHNFIDEMGMDFDFAMTNLGERFGDIVVQQDTVSIADRATTSMTPAEFLALGDSTPRSLQFTASFLDDFQATLLVKASQLNKRTITLNAPKLTLFNGQRAYVMIVRQIAFISDLEPVPDTLGFDVTVGIVNSGVILDVEATVSADRRYVTMTLRPDLASLREPIRQLEISSATPFNDDDDGDSNFIFTTGFIELPEVELTRIRSTVSVPDQGTLLTGGQRLVGETELEAGVPVLSKIPILNRLFTNTSLSKDERTLLILIKPTIIIQREEEDTRFPGMLDNPSEFGIGQGLGLNR